MKDYLILITEESKPVLVEVSQKPRNDIDDPLAYADSWMKYSDEYSKAISDKSKHIQFKDEQQVRNLLSPEEFRLHRIGQTFPLPTGYKVSFEYIDPIGNTSSVPLCDSQTVAILSKLEEPKEDNICEHCGKLYCDNFLKHNSCGEMPDWTSLAYEPDHEFFNNWPTPIKEQAKLEHKKILRDYTNFLSSMDYFGKPASNPVKGYVGEYLDKIKVVAPSEEEELPDSIDQIWMDVCVECHAIEKVGVAKVIRTLREKFKIERF